MCLVVERKICSDINVPFHLPSQSYGKTIWEKRKGRSHELRPFALPSFHATAFIWLIVPFSRRQRLVERTGDHVELLFLGELDEVHRVAGDAHGQVRVLLRMLDGILELLLAQHVDVGVVQAVAIAGVQDANEVADTLFLVAAQTIRVMVLVSEMPSRASL